jgi:CubicO group peptidase (beta-lactamase class C family)
MWRPDPARTVARQLGAHFPDLDARAVETSLRRTLRPGGVVALGQNGVQTVLTLRQEAGDSFEIASVTKPFTAALAMALAAQGRIELDAPLSKQLTRFRGYPPSVTARALMTHTAGLPAHPLRGALGVLQNFHDPYGRLSADAVLASGRRWAWWGRGLAGRLSYSNFGYGLLALACAEAAGEAYPEALRRHVLDPLALHQTDFAPRTRLATPHGFFGSSDTSGFGGLTGAGGLYSTASDLLRFAAAHLEDQLSGWDTFTRPAGSPPSLVGVAGGWFVARWHRRLVWWHDGTARGTRAALGLCPETGRAAVVLVTSGPAGGRSGPGPLLSELL